MFKQRKNRLPKKKPSALRDAEGGKALFLFVFAGRGDLGGQRGKEGGEPGGFGGQREMQHQLSAGVGEPVFRLRQQPAGRSFTSTRTS